MDKDKPGSIEKIQVLGDGSSGLMCDLYKEYTSIYDLDISENESISEIWKKWYNSITQGIVDITSGLCTMAMLWRFNRLL